MTFFPVLVRLAWDLELSLCFVVSVFYLFTFFQLHYTLTHKMSCVARIGGGAIRSWRSVFARGLLIPERDLKG